MLEQKIKEDLQKAILARDVEKRDVLRMIDSMIKNEKIELKKKNEELSNDEIIKIITRAVKQRKDSVKQYTKGGRKDLAEKEEMEIEILRPYLPKQLSEDELRNIIKEVASQMNAQGVNDLGKVMGVVMGKAKGKADGNLVRKIVLQELEK